MLPTQSESEYALGFEWLCTGTGIYLEGLAIKIVDLLLVMNASSGYHGQWLTSVNLFGCFKIKFS